MVGSKCHLETKPNSSDAQTQQPVHQSPKLERPRSLSLHTDEPPQPEVVPPLGDENGQDPEELRNPSEVDSAELQAHLENLSIEKKSISELAQSPRVKILERENNIIPADNPVGYTPRTPSNLTEQGFLDLKFYHSRLW